MSLTKDDIKTIKELLVEQKDKITENVKNFVEYRVEKAERFLEEKIDDEIIGVRAELNEVKKNISQLRDDMKLNFHNYSMFVIASH
jgi:ribosome-associated translation inhibitor RaiA